MKRIATVAGSVAAALTIAGCGGTTDDTRQSSAPVSEAPGTTTAPAPPTTTPAPAATTPKPSASAIPASLCPPNPPANGKLSDQGTATGRVGRTSYTYADESGGIFGCVAVLAVERVSGGDVGIRVLVKNNGQGSLDLSTDSPTVRVQYGEDNITADPVGDAGGSTALLRPGQRTTVQPAFTVPADVKRITVVVGFSSSDDAGVWESVAVAG